MKKIFLMLMTLLCVTPIMAQKTLNDQADNIVGTYNGKQGDDRFRAKVVKLSDGSYRGQVVWMERDKDENGNKILDSKNPNKNLRSTPADRIILFSGLKYNSRKHCWDGTKIYDPQRGMSANMTASFTNDGRLKITGSVALISESVYWEKVKE